MQHLFYFPPGATNNQQKLCKAVPSGGLDKLKRENWKMGAITSHRRLLPSCVSIQKHMIIEAFKDADKL